MNLLSSCKNSQTFNGTCTCLQVQSVSSGKLHTKLQWEKRLKKSDSSVGSGSGSDSKIEATHQTQWANFDDPDNINTSKQQ